MARGTTTDFSVNGKQIVKAAMRKFGALEGGGDPAGDQLADGIEALNALAKAWMGSPDIETSGLKMWQRARATLTLSAKISFALKTGGDLVIDPPVAILTAMLKTTTGSETPLLPMIVEDFEAIPDKSSNAAGTPSRYYYERGYAQGTFYLNCIPSVITDVVDLVYLRPLYDYDSATDDTDFPQHWSLALVWNLALELAPEFGAEITQHMKERAAYHLLKAQNFYPEQASEDDYFQPGKD